LVSVLQCAFICDEQKETLRRKEVQQDEKREPLNKKRKYMHKRHLKDEKTN